jgi:hypothetical protein
MYEIITLRLLHVLGGIFWLGSGLFTTLFLLPSLAGVGPAAGAVMAAMQRRRLFTVLPVVALVTVLSGLRLLWIASGGLDGRYFATGSGRAFAASGAIALLAFLLGMLLARPAMLRAAKLAATMTAASDDAERDARVRQIAALQQRGATMNRLAILLLTLGAAGMAVARYIH